MSVLDMLRFAPEEPPRWQPPRYTMWVILTVGQNAELLGELPDGKGRLFAWYRFVDGEAEATDSLISEEHVANGVYTHEVHEGRRYLRVLRVHAPGTFAARSKPKPISAAVVRAGRPFDALDVHSILTKGDARTGFVRLRGGDAVVYMKRRGYLEVGGEWAYHPPDGGRDPRLSALREPMRPVLEGHLCIYGCGRKCTTSVETARGYGGWCGDWPCAQEVRNAA